MAALDDPKTLGRTRLSFGRGYDSMSRPLGSVKVTVKPASSGAVVTGAVMAIVSDRAAFALTGAVMAISCSRALSPKM